MSRYFEEWRLVPLRNLRVETGVGCQMTEAEYGAYQAGVYPERQIPG
ncbi:hypothetical protein [Paludibaculum fermentans]